MPKLAEEEERGKTVLMLLSAEFKLFGCSMSHVAGRYVAHVPLSIDDTAKPLSSVPIVSQKPNTIIPQPRGDCTILTLLPDFTDRPILHDIPAMNSSQKWKTGSIVHFVLVTRVQ
jgi:hypothetical protein